MILRLTLLTVHVTVTVAAQSSSEGYRLKVPGHGPPSTIHQLAVDAAGEEGADLYAALFRENCVREQDVQALADWDYDHLRLPLHDAMLLDAAVMGGAGRGALTVDGEPWGQADVPASGNAWTPLALGTRALRAGPHTLRLWVREGGFDLERLTVDLATTD